MLKKYFWTDFFGRPYRTNGIKTRLGLLVLRYRMYTICGHALCVLCDLEFTFKMNCIFWFSQ